MKVKIAILLLFFAGSLLLSSCEKDRLAKDEQSEMIKKSRRGQGGKKNQPPPPPPAEVFTGYYQLQNAHDFDPLFRFAISASGQFMMLESDASISSWGTDFWGYWDEPFAYTNQQVNYTFGLSNTSYTFSPIAVNEFDVYKRVIIHPYLSGTADTAYSLPGIYTLEL